MYKKIFISFLLLALMNFLVGCYSSESITVTEYDQMEEEDKPDEIKVIAKDFKEYHFSNSNFYVHNDTLYGKEKFLSKGLPFEGKFAFWEIESIQLEDFSQRDPTPMSVSQYQKIEVESGKPDEIYLTKYDTTRYHFMKDDFYIGDDTLFGKGKLLSGDREELLDKKIALSDIESIEVESLNWVTTALFVLGIAAASIVVFVGVLILIEGPPNY
jgi:hypothetical protein